jgi:hypothetical protein
VIFRVQLWIYQRVRVSKIAQYKYGSFSGTQLGHSWISIILCEIGDDPPNRGARAESFGLKPHQIRTNKQAPHAGCQKLAIQPPQRKPHQVWHKPGLPSGKKHDNGTFLIYSSTILPVNPPYFYGIFQLGGCGSLQLPNWIHVYTPRDCYRGWF